MTSLRYRIEADETVDISIASVINALEDGAQQQIVTITDNDAAPTVTLTIDQAAISEAAGTAVVTATLSQASSRDVTVNLDVSGTADATGADFVPISAIIIPAGSQTGTVSIMPIDDAADELDETVIVDIRDAVNATENGVQQVTTTILDDDSAASVSIAATSASIPENGGTATFRLTKQHTQFEEKRRRTLSDSE